MTALNYIACSLVLLIVVMFSVMILGSQAVSAGGF